MKSISILIIIASILNSCSIKDKTKYGNNSLIEQASKQYKESRNFFSSELIKHFPIEFDSNCLRYSSCYSKELGPLSLYLVKYFSNTDVLTQYKMNSLANYSASDSCLLVVNKFATLDRNIDVKLTENEKKDHELKCYNDKFPIPNFYEFNYDSNNKLLWQIDKDTKVLDCKLPSDYNICVIDAKAGWFYKDSLLSTNIIMPRGWEHGFSKGISYSTKNKIIIYWLNIW